MTPLLLCITNAIFVAQRADHALPQRVELEPEAFKRLQADNRSALPAFGVEVILHGTVAGVPIVQRDVAGGVLIRADGSRTPLTIPPPIG